MRNPFSLVRRLSQISTILFVRLFGTQVGSDGHGQRYFRLRHADWAGRESRMVLYAGEPEASKIPPLWRAWLCHENNQGLPEGGRDGYVMPPVPNLTGTDASFLPQGHVIHRLSCGSRIFCEDRAGTWSPPE